MKSDYSIYDVINDSYLTLFGFTAYDEDILFKFYDTICYRNSGKVVRLYTDNYHSKHSSFENYTINTIEEIYEIISKLENKIIIIDNIGQLPYKKVDSSNVITKSKLLKGNLQKLRVHCNINDCVMVLGSHMYNSMAGGINGSTNKSFVGGNSLMYGADNIFVVDKGELNCVKSRYIDPKEICGINIKKVYLREESLRQLLGE